MVGKKVVVLGGGPCGLSAAWELSKQGIPVTVIEKESEGGGLCRTIAHRGFRFDLGGHRFISRSRPLIQQISQLMGDELLSVERKSAIRLRGQTYRYPLSMKDIVCKMNPALSVKAVADYLINTIFPRMRHQSGPSFEAWVLNRFGPTLYEIFFKGYTQKVWGIHPKTLSADWAVQRIPVLKFQDVLRELVGRTKRRHEAYAKKFYYPKKGIGQIFEVMSQAVVKNGGIIHFNAEATGLALENNVIKGVTFQQGGHHERVDCDFLISTIPLPELHGMISPDRKKARLPFRSIRFLNILIDQPRISEHTWLYVPERRYVMTRIQEPKLRSPFNAPPDKTSLILEIPCHYRDAVWCADDKALFDRAINDLSSLGIHIKPSVIDYFSTYVEQGYPVYQLGYKDRVEALRENITQYRNLITTGRQGLFRYIFMDQAMLMGIKAAKRVMKGKVTRSLEEIGMEKELLEGKTVRL